MQCRAIDHLPEGQEWEYELKFDGYRALAFKTGRRVWLMSRNERDFAPFFPAMVRALEKLPQDTIIDGEIVALNASGQPAFNLLQNYQTAAQTIVFYAFDLLMLSGQNLMDRPLRERRELLQKRVMHRLREPMRLSETLTRRRTGCSKPFARSDWRASLPNIAAAPTRRVGGTWVKFRVKQGTGIRDWRLHPKGQELRCDPGRLL
jgi:bifunctional non-homologous end joining protein LigD